MKLILGDKINYKWFKIILDIFLILVGGYVLCRITYFSVRYFYFTNNGVKNKAVVSYEGDSVLLMYTVNGKQYLFDITNELKPDGVEEIYYLPQQPDKFYRIIYWKATGYGWWFLCVLMAIRFILLKVVQYLPRYVHYRYRKELFSKEIIRFPRNKK